MISVKNLIFDYPTKRALHGVSLEIAPQSITALVGPNGAGKTTLMRAIAALDRFEHGSISVAGLDVRRQPREVHEVLGYLPDFFGLYEDLTVRQCLHYRALAHRVPENRLEAAVEQAAEAVNLRDRLGELAGALSRGLRQRLAIAQAIVHEPKVLLLDEPASGLDPDARQDLSRLFLQLQAAGLTQIVSSHILAELEDYSTSLIVIDQGRIVRQTDVADATKSEAPLRLRVRGLGPEEALAAALEAATGQAPLRGKEGEFVVQVAADASAQAALLSRLMGEGHDLYLFHPVPRRLQDLYFEGVGRPGEVHLAGTPQGSSTNGSTSAPGSVVGTAPSVSQTPANNPGGSR